MMNTEELLEMLTSVPCMGGSENRMIDLLCKILAPFGEVRTDAVNNVICTFGEGFHLLLDAHTDEVGMVVTSVTDDGFIKAGACGGIDKRMLSGAEVSIWGKREVKGIISALPPHLVKASDEKKAPEISEISIDVGMSREDAEKIISLGDKITFKRHFTELIGSRVSSNCLDDRAGVAAVILALEKLKKLPIKVTALFSTQEELGTRGAKIGPYGLNADEAIAIDVSFGYTPNCRKDECGEVGKGAMIGISPALDKNISDGLIAAAKKNEIKYQIEVMNGKTGTDADVISVSGCGIRSGLISIPLKYMHTPVEVVDINDVESVAALITAYAEERAGV